MKLWTLPIMLIISLPVATRAGDVPPKIALSQCPKCAKKSGARMGAYVSSIVTKDGTVRHRSCPGCKKKYVDLDKKELKGEKKEGKTDE